LCSPIFQFVNQGAEVLVYALPISTVQEVAEIKKLLLIHNHPFIEVMIALLSCYAP
jgi:hypothetical protein